MLGWLELEHPLWRSLDKMLRLQERVKLANVARLELDSAVESGLHTLNVKHLAIHGDEFVICPSFAYYIPKLT